MCVHIILYILENYKKDYIIISRGEKKRARELNVVETSVSDRWFIHTTGWPAAPCKKCIKLILVEEQNVSIPCGTREMMIH